MRLYDSLNLVIGQAPPPPGPIPDPRAGAAPPGLDKVQTLMHWVFVLAGVAAVIGVMVVGARMALSSRSHGGENPNVGALGWATAGAVVISVASAAVSVLLG